MPDRGTAERWAELAELEAERDEPFDTEPLELPELALPPLRVDPARDWPATAASEATQAKARNNDKALTRPVLRWGLVLLMIDTSCAALLSRTILPCKLRAKNTGPL